jgi:serpin B
MRTETMLVALTIFTVTACQQEAGPPREFGEVVRSAKTREMAPEVSTETRQELVAGMTEFAFDLYGELADEDDNVFVSPYSISVALGMTYAGARGGTETEMGEALHFTLPQEELHPTTNWLDLELASRGEGASGMDGGPFRLGIANAIWGRTGREFVPEYLDLIAENYGSGLRVLDFATDPEASREVINAWVADQTEDRIQDLLPQGSITPDTAMVLTNAIYFNAAWKLAFDPDFSSDGSFTRLSGETVTTNLMNITAEFPYASVDGSQAIELPYDGDELSMVVILPAEGSLEVFEAGMTGQVLSDLIAAMHTTEVMFTMPSFSFTTEYMLKDALMALGMELAFGAADFTGMDPYGSMVISEVVHKAFIAVSEEGTEAAAATGVIMEDTSVSETTTMRVDRPFLFLIRDIETGSVLFLGRVGDPTAE